MAKKEFTYRGRTIAQLKTLSHKELAALLPARARRRIKRGFNDQENKLIKDITRKPSVKTHLRTMLILPDMIGKTIKIHNGREFVPIQVQEEMIGHYLGEFALTRKKVQHSAPGIGATKSSANVAVR